MTTHYKRYLHANPLSKGNIGKTTAYEGFASWLNSEGILWTGANLDDRHPAFANRYPGLVKTYTLGAGVEARNELLKVFRRGLEAKEPVFILDTRAQADALVKEAIESLNIFELAEQNDTKIVFWLIPYDDDEHTRNLAETVLWAQDAVQWVVAKNPVKARCDRYEGSKLQKTLKDYGAVEVELPTITPASMSQFESASIKAKKELSFAEAATGQFLPDIYRGEFSWFLTSLFSQFEAIADKLVPLAEAATISQRLAETSTKKARKNGKPKDEVSHLVDDYNTVE